MASAQASTEMAITIDDLPNSGPLPDGVSRLDVAKMMLDTLRRHQIIEAYGFINAEHVEHEPETLGVLKEWVARGYPLGNHTFSHKALSKVSAAEFLEGIAKNEPLLNQLSSGRDYKWFRYPFLIEGDTPHKREAVRDYLSKAGYKIAQVTIDFQDYMWNDAYVRCVEKGDRERIDWLKQSYLASALGRLDRGKSLANVLFHRPMKHILVLHIGVFDAMMLDALLTEFEKRDVQFIRLADAGKDEAYTLDPHVMMTYGGGFLEQLMASGHKKYLPSSKVPWREVEQTCR